MKTLLNAALWASLHLVIGTRADTVREYVTVFTVTETALQPSPIVTPIPAGPLDERDLSIGSVLTTTKTYAATTNVITRTVAIDNPRPTVVYYCKNMPQICKNTRDAGALADQVTWLYAYEAGASKQNRDLACPAWRRNQCQATGRCDTKIRDPRDWRISCDEAPPASFLNGGAGAATECASYREQKAQGTILSLVSYLRAGDGAMYRDAKKNRAYEVVFKLDDNPSVAGTAYGALIPGGAKLSDGSTRREVTFEAKGPTGTPGQFIHATSTAQTYSIGGRFRSQTCTPTAGTCSNQRFAMPVTQSWSKGVIPTPAPTSVYNHRVVAAATTSKCKSKSPRDRSRDKANQAQQDADRVKDAKRLIDLDSQFAQNVRDTAAAAAAAAILAAALAANIGYSSGDDDTTRQQVYDAASSALRADAGLKTITNPKIQSLYSAVSSAAVDATAAANIASTFLPSPTTPAGQSQDGGYVDPYGGYTDDDDGGSPACILPGSSRTFGYAARDGSVDSCYPKYDIRSSAASNGRVTLAFTEKDGGFLGFRQETNSGCSGVYVFTATETAVTQWIPDCTSSTNGQVVPFHEGAKLVSGLALLNGIALLAISAKSQSGLDCYAKSLKRGSFKNDAVYQILPGSNCRVAGNVQHIDPAALFNLSIPVPGETMSTSQTTTTSYLTSSRNISFSSLQSFKTARSLAGYFF